MRANLTKPGLNLRLVNLPSYSPDFNPDGAIWGWAHQEVTANLCLGTRAAVRESVGGFFTDPSRRREEVKRRCRTVLQARTTALTSVAQADLLRPANTETRPASATRSWRFTQDDSLMESEYA